MTQIRGFYRYQLTIKCVLYMRLSTFVYLHCDFSLDPFILCHFAHFRLTRVFDPYPTRVQFGTV